MDKTPLFKAVVLSLRQEKNASYPQPDKKRILQNRPKDDFSKQAKDVCNKITTLRNILLENRSAYMRIGMHLKSAAQISDEQRDIIDKESEKFISFYTQHLAQMRCDWKKIKKKQYHEHVTNVIDTLCDYLKTVQKIYVEQKKYRVQHELETYRLLKLAPDKKKIPVRLACDKTKQNGRSKSSSSASTLSSKTNSDVNEEDCSTSSDDGNNIRPSQRRNKKFASYQNQKSSSNKRSELQQKNDLKSQHSQSQVALDEDYQKSHQQLVDEEEVSKELSPEDIQMFEEENYQLYQELQGLSEEVEQIEKNVVDIANLQDLFTEKVSFQKHNIDRIVNAVIGSTENVKDANEQIKQAIQRSAGLRVWSLFFLLVMSFTLLFLDWYYD